MPLREFVVYACGALAAFVVDLAVLTALVELASIHYLLAATVAFICGTAVVYWVSVRHAFRYRRLASAGDEFSIFAAIGIVGVLMNASVMLLAVEVFDLHYLLGKLASAGVTFMANFGLRKALLFSSWPMKAQSSPDQVRP